MDSALLIAERVSNVLYLLLALSSLRLWLRHRDAASAWLAATFASLGAIVAVGLFTGDEPTTAVSTISIITLAAFPYLLYRFAGTFDRPHRRVEVAAVSATLVIVVATFGFAFTTGFPASGEPPSGLYAVFLAAFVVQWFGILGTVAARLWRAGRGQPSVARRRMRLLAVANMVIVAALSLAIVGAELPGLQLAGQVAAALAAMLFFLGFDTPDLLRAAWRADAEDELYGAAVALMKARRPDEVADVLVPHIARVLGARAVRLGTGTGEVATYGNAAGEATRTVALHGATISLWGSRYAPLLGDEEDRLLGRLGLLADLALDRTALLRAEQEARREVETVNEELEAFVYSASHDLKTPLIAFLGYLDLLTTDHGGTLPPEAHRFLERMRSNGLHMQALIGDLLELSRVGRVDTEPTRIDLGLLVGSVAEDLAPTAPDARVHVVGELPDIWINANRIRQLLVNVIANALKHAGRGDVTIRVSATAPSTDGTVEIRVLDDGVGIPTEHLERVTKVFERLEGRAGEGTGMGLAIARKICTDAGGDLRFQPHTGGADLRLVLLSPPDRPTGGGSDGVRPERAVPVRESTR